MAMEIFKLIGSVMVDSDQANESLQKTDDKAQGVGKTLANGVGKAAKWGAAMVAGTAAVAGAAVKLASDSASTADTIDKASQRMNISAESYQELSHAASLCGVEMSTMEKAAKKLEGTDLNMDQALEQIYALETAEERSAKAAELFGDSVAYSMSPMLNASAEDMASMKQEARDLGLVMSNETVASGAELNDSLSKVKDSFTALATNLGATLMPIVKQVCDLIIQYMPQIQALFDKLAPVIGDMLEQILPLLVQMAADILPVLLPPLVQIISAILPVITQLMTTLLPPLIQIAEMILPILMDVIIALLPALEPLIACLQPMIELLMLIIKPLLQLLGAILPPLTKVITVLAKAFSGVLLAALNAIRPIFVDFGNKIKAITEVVKSMVSTVGAKFTELKNKIITPLTNAKDKVKEIIDKIKGFFSGMKLSFPKIKLPHFTVKPAGWSIGDLLKGVKPSLGIDWYAKGGILEQPTVMNAAVGGEAGKEAVIPLERNTKGIELIAGKISENMADPSQAIVKKLDELLTAINDVKAMGVTLDTGALVGGLAKPMDKALGQMAVSKARYV